MAGGGHGLVHGHDVQVEAQHLVRAEAQAADGVDAAPAGALALGAVVDVHQPPVAAVVEARVAVVVRQDAERVQELLLDLRHAVGGPHADVHRRLALQAAQQLRTRQ